MSWCPKKNWSMYTKEPANHKFTYKVVRGDRIQRLGKSTPHGLEQYKIYTVDEASKNGYYFNLKETAKSHPPTQLSPWRFNVTNWQLVNPVQSPQANRMVFREGDTVVANHNHKEYGCTGTVLSKMAGEPLYLVRHAANDVHKGTYNVWYFEWELDLVTPANTAITMAEEMVKALERGGYGGGSSGGGGSGGSGSVTSVVSIEKETPDKLIKVINQSIRYLAQKFPNQFETVRQDCLALYQVKEPPTRNFEIEAQEGVTLGARAVVIKGDRVTIGCQIFDRKQLESVLDRLCEESGQSIAIGQGTAIAVRLGIKYLDYRIKWGQADILLRELKSYKA